MKAKDFIVTIIAIGISIGYYYNHDMLQAEEVNLKHHPYFFTSEQFNFLYFCTYFAQFLFLFPLGILVDQFSLKIIMIMLITVSFVAQTILGVLLSNRSDGYLTFMYVTRGVLGISGLGIIIVQGKLVNRFSKKHYEYIMGLCLNVPYCFNALNSFLTALVQEQSDSVPLCFFIGSFFCLISLGFGVYCIIKLLNQQDHAEQNNQKTQGYDWAVIKEFKIQFWVLVLSIFLTEGSINPFIDNLSDFFQKSFGMQNQTIGKIVPILFICLTPFSLVLGKFIEVFPAQKRNIMVGSRLLYLLAMISLALMPQTDSPSSFNSIMIVLFLLIMSFNWAVFHSILEPCIAYYVKQQYLGMAWGIVCSVLGLSQSLFSLVNIYITGSSKSVLKSYQKLIMTYIGVAGIALGLAVWVKFRGYERLDQTLEEGQNSQQFLEQVNNQK